jgi:hypothetical protein
MNTNQQAALAALAGRALTSAEIALATARNDADLATSLSVGLTKTVKTLIGIGAVMDALGAVPGAAFLDAMEALAPTISAIKWGLSLLNADKFDVGSQASIGVVNTLVLGGEIGAVTVAAGTVPQAVATALLGLAVVPAPIDTAQVSAILNGA